MKKPTFLMSLQRSIMIVAILFGYSNISAAHTIGEIIDYDGMKCLVVSIDTINGRILLMAPPAEGYDGKKPPMEYARSKGKYSDFKAECVSKGGLKLFQERENDKKLTNKYKEEALKIMTDRRGDVNKQSLDSLCRSLGIAQTDYFPAYAWAASLGDGWFIGGENELILYGLLENSIGSRLIYNIDRSTPMYYLNQYPPHGLSKGMFFFPAHIICSTTAYKYHDKNKPTHQSLLLLGRLNKFGNIYETYFDIRTYVGGISKYDVGRNDSLYGQEVTVFSKHGTWMQSPKWCAFKWI